VCYLITKKMKHSVNVLLEHVYVSKHYDPLQQLHSFVYCCQVHLNRDYKHSRASVKHAQSALR